MKYVVRCDQCGYTARTDDERHNSCPYCEISIGISQQLTQQYGTGNQEEADMEKNGMTGIDRVRMASDARSGLEGAVSYLYNLASAASVLGMKVMADRLSEIAEDINSDTDRLYRAWCEEQGEAYRRVEESAANTVRAALAGATLAAQDADPLTHPFEPEKGEYSAVCPVHGHLAE